MIRLPFHVPPLRPAEGKDAGLGKYVKAQRIDALLVDDNETFLLRLRVIDSLVTDEVLELNDLLDLHVDELALGFDELFALLGRGVEKSRINFAGQRYVSRERIKYEGKGLEDLRLLILQADVDSEDESVLDTLRHVGMTPAVVHDKATDKFRLRGRAMLHLHDLHHVEVDRCSVLVLSICVNMS
jgi:hypothetical protein